jgi:murein biosynthesis integral membrane protein MurJ
MAQPAQPADTVDTPPERQLKVLPPIRSANRLILHALLRIGSAALLIRVVGMVNQIVVTSHFGAGLAMDAYFVALAAPTLVAQLIGGSIEASVIPVYARMRARGTPEQASTVFSTLLNLFLIGSALLTVLLFLPRRQLLFITAPGMDLSTKELALGLTPFVYPAIVLMIVIGYLENILNAEGQFGWPAYAGILVPLATIVFVLGVGGSHGVVILCIGTLVGLLLQLGVTAARMRCAAITYRLVIDVRGPVIGSIMVAAWPVLMSGLLVHLSPVVDQIFASFLTAGSISALSYALKLLSVPLSVIFAAAAHSALPYLARQAAEDDMQAFKQTLRLYVWAVGIGAAAVSAVMIVLAHPLIQILFQRGTFTGADTSHTAVTLQGFLIGLSPMALGFLIPKAYSAIGKTQMLMYISVVSVLANGVFDYIFARFWQSFGIALSTSMVFLCTTVIQLIMLRRAVGDLGLLTPPPELLNTLHMLRKLISRESGRCA